MSSAPATAGTWQRGVIGAVLALFVGLVLWSTAAGLPLLRLSYDLPVRLRTASTARILREVALVHLEAGGGGDAPQAGASASPAVTLPAFIERLVADTPRLVVVNRWLGDLPPSDADLLGQRLAALSNVVVAAKSVALADGRTQPVAPTNLLEAATGWGLAHVWRDGDAVVRRLYAGTADAPGLAWAAAGQMQPAVSHDDTLRSERRWLHYYGPAGTLPSFSLSNAQKQPPGFFHGKIVFLGGEPGGRGEAAEFAFATAYGRHGAMSGTELQATMFLNLWRGDWLQRMPAAWEFLWLAAGAIVAGVCASRRRAVEAALFALSGGVAVTAIGCALAWWGRTWFCWLLVVAVQIPAAFAAWGWPLLRTLNWPARRPAPDPGPAPVPPPPSPAPANVPSPPSAAAAATSTPEAKPAARAPTALPLTPKPPRPRPVPILHKVPPTIPDHRLLRLIDNGAYGEVWLARNGLGQHHAIKIIYRKTFEHAGPFEREFQGLRKFLPVSQGHPGFVRLLQLDRDDDLGCFWCIMELADDLDRRRDIDAERYRPCTLAAKLDRRARPPLKDCVQMALDLAGALDYLHQQQLIHRDIKPSNIIFVDGLPKLADAGLVTDLTAAEIAVERVGTEGYVPPEGSGSPAADVFSFGKVLYETATGQPASGFPTLLSGTGADAATRRLLAIIAKSCAADTAQRYRSATDLYTDLLEVQKMLAG